MNFSIKICHETIYSGLSDIATTLRVVCSR